jgi:ubiquinone/menaquinone biosynthesis C-methylase UbiE
MDHADHVRLLRGGIPGPGGVWADLGSGDGAFTLALRELVGPDAEIYSVDRDGGRLREQARAFERMFPASRVHFVQADLARGVVLPPLDGAVMANVLHFFRDKAPLL